MALAGRASSQTPVPWSEDFEGYAPGTNIAAQKLGGWEHWDLAALMGEVVSTNQARSGSNSYFIGGNSDSVQVYKVTSGRWTLKGHIYVPTAAGPDQLTKDSWWIALNTYSAGGPKHWSLQLSFNPTSGAVTYQGGANGGQSTLAFFDQWAEIRCEIDLDQDLCQVYYGLPGAATAFGSPFQWSDGVSAGFGVKEIQCLDLWANDQQTAPNPNGGVYYDDVSLTLAATPVTKFCTAKAGLACGVPAISASGVSSASQSSGFLVHAGPARSDKSGILVYNTALATGPLPFQGGTLCVEPMGLRRAGSTNSQGMCPPGSNCMGVFSIDMNQFAAGLWVVPDCAGAPTATAPNSPAAYLGTAGTTVHTTYWGRDSVATGSFVSDGLSYDVGP
jgi:hypothetical protein